MPNEVFLVGKDRTGDIKRVRVDNKGSLLSSFDFRDVTTTGHVVIPNNTADNEVTVIAADDSNYLDLVYVSCANNSDVAVRIAIRAGAGTGNHADVIEVPPNDTKTVHYPIPIPQDEQATVWTADFDSADITNTTVSVTMLAFKNNETRAD